MLFIKKTYSFNPIIYFLFFLSYYTPYKVSITNIKINQLYLFCLISITYIWIIFVMISRITLFLQLHINTYTDFKKALFYYEPKLSNPEIGIQITYNNVYLLTFWCLNYIDIMDRFNYNDPDFDLCNLDCQFLDQKYDEQNVQEFNHKLPGKEAKIDIYKKNEYIFGFFVIGSGWKMFDFFFSKSFMARGISNKKSE